MAEVGDSTVTTVRLHDFLADACYLGTCDHKDDCPVVPLRATEVVIRD